MREVSAAAAGSAAMAGLLGAAAWLVGLDPFHSALLGSAVLAVASGRAILRLDDVAETGRRWAQRPAREVHGTRHELRELTWKLTGGRGRVQPAALQRLQALAEHRLARHGVDLHDPAHAERAQRLLGVRPYRVLTSDPSARVRFRVFVACVEALERLADPPPLRAHDGTRHARTVTRTAPGAPSPPAQEPRS